MNDTLTICEFLAQTGAQARYFDMGRRVAEISSDQMLAFERAEQPYHQPFLQTAWLGILFHYPEHNSTGEPGTPEQHIWFLKLPLDERGHLQLAARDGFLHQIIETASLKKQGKLDEHGHIDDNPLGFAPREDRMAVFHAKVAHATGQTGSQFYAHARDYFSGSVGFEQWNFVGLQGIADVVARVTESDNLPNLVAAIPQLPVTPFAALCSCLENDPLAPALCAALATRIHAALAQNDTVAVAAGVRGLAHRDNHNHARETIMTVLAQASGRDVEVLAAIAGRAWELLENDALRRAFLENLAACPAGQQAFDGIMADLMFMPRLREPLLADMRRPERSEQLSSAIGAFFQSMQPPAH